MFSLIAWTDRATYMLYRDFTVQIVAVNNSRKRATVKLIPRIDLQAMTEKFVTNHLTDLYLFFSFFPA